MAKSWKIPKNIGYIDTGEWEMFLISSIRSKNKDVVFAHSRNVYGLT